MAEIKIEKKKAVWPWIIAIIILALLIYFLAFNDRDEMNKEETTTEEVTSIQIEPVTEAVSITLT